MRKKTLTLLVYSVTLLSALLIPAIYASPPVPVSGEWTYAVTLYEEVKDANGNTFKYGEEIGTWTGTFEGTSFDYFELVIHPNGFVTCQGRIAFTGSVDGKSGTMEILFVGKKDLTVNLWSGKWVILGSAGELTGLKGHGTWEGPSFDLDYEGYMHFNPN